MKQTTLVFVFNEKGQILLSMKKRGFGEGKYNGAGGKLEIGEDIIDGAIRELKEETSVNLTKQDLEYKGVLHFYFEGKEEWNQDVSIFFSYNYNGKIKETEEMKPFWFDIKDIPYNKMWEDDEIWLPRLLAGEKEIEYNFIFGVDGLIKSHKTII